MRPWRPASLRALPALARRPVGLGCTLMLGLALATVSASDPVSAEQAASEPRAAETTPELRPVDPVADPRPADAAHATPAAPAVATQHAGDAATGGNALPASAAVPFDPTAPAAAPAQAVTSLPAAAPAHSATPAQSATPAPSATPAQPASPAQSATSPAASSPAQARSPTQPRSLLPLVQPLWSELSAAQRQSLAPLESQWNTLTRDEKRPWLTLAARLPKMDAKSRARAEKRIQEWAALTPEQRRLARNNYRLAKKLPKEQRVATWEQYQQMTPEQQAVLRQAGWTSNTAARHAGAPTGLAKEAAQPLWRRLFKWIWNPETDQPAANGKPADGASR